MTLRDMQDAVGRWTLSTFGESIHTNVKERCLRMVEEAIELAQALELDVDDVHRLVDYVYSRKVGRVGQEIAGTVVTLLAVATAARVDAMAETEYELTRIQTPEVIERCRRRQSEKREALITDERKP